MAKKTIQVRLEPEDAEKLKTIAKKTDRTLSNLLRRIIKNYFIMRKTK